ncbi:GNAT family N-acetyltransferase [Haematomicrobium sanguinis]|uniref:GNAT family N-acetyltransferase n=1 Tax=Haematomicrobium sanguinis TaxID=479106 RepID=UPI00047EBC25|nr:GNAT family protein [Haematomicrobium sanguinis]
MARSAIWPSTLQHADLTLRPIRYRDAKEFLEVRRRNSAWLAPWEATSPVAGERPATFYDMVRQLNRQAASATALPYILTLREDGEERLIGQVTVSTIMWGSARSASIGYWISEDVAGRGLMPTAVALATDHCFRGLNLHRVEINIRPENAPSLAVVRKLGFRDEGLRKKFLHIDGKWTDHRTFALLEDEVPEGVLSRYLAQRESTSER